MSAEFRIYFKGNLFWIRQILNIKSYIPFIGQLIE